MSNAQAQVLDLEILPSWNQDTLETTSPRSQATQGTPIVERLDFLLSSLALERIDGTWIESENWSAFFSLEKGRLKTRADGIPTEEFKAIRFDVGIPAAQDRADPNLLPADHPLHPNVCGLHWGWQGGYVFMALEGRWMRPDGELGGFAFHLARTPNYVRVEIPVNFQGGGPLTLKLVLDAAHLLEGIDFTRDGTSTHSRDGDLIVPLLKRNIARAFSLHSVKYDLYQSAVKNSEAKSQELPAGTHPYPIAITSRFPRVQFPADNPLTQEGVALGEKLFNDPRLSINNSQSCASCHSRDAAFSDPRQYSIGAIGQVGKRHAMPLFNLAWDQSFFWDGRASTLREQVLMPIQDQHEMNETLERVVEKISDTSASFNNAFGTPEITSERIAKSLEQYLLTLVSQESRFDRAARKVAQMTEEEKRGLQLFVTEFDPARGLRGADCFHCHGGTLFTDHQFKNNGLELTPADLGRMIVTGNPADKGKFKTPSLRNIAVTAPYMHDGRFTTLEEVVEHYSSGVKRSDTLDPNLAKHPDAGLQLTTEEKSALVAFLKTLTDEAFIADPAKTKLAQRP
ncbi:MbnP family protein [Prosthecobacter fusiformis]|uniref:MbnP family protein n=1 Tax=Prosthecobacter fusiformis TaxID=48464 RepID=UPI00141523DB|nr:MbnP family protein [Prosthecobacter fusiformis]